MKSASAALINLLASNQFIWADLYTFTFANGTIVRYTGADRDLTVGGNLFSSASPYINRGAVKTLIGVEVDTLAISFLVNSNLLINSIPLAQFASNGGFDGARVKLERVFMATWGDTSAGTLINFVGRVADVSASRAQIDLTVNSDLELLNIMLPRNVYQAGCVHSLYDQGCGVVAASYTSTANTTANSTKTSVNCNLVVTNGYFDQGTMAFTSGNNAGVIRTVKLYTTGVLVPSLPLPYIPAAGDLMSVKAGCDHQMATCNSKFNNLANFRGYPFIPVPETTY